MTIVNQTLKSATGDVSLIRSVTLVSKWGLRVVWFGYASLLFFLTHTPIPQSVSSVTSNWDKALHWGAYFGLAVLTATVCLKSAPRRISLLLIFFLLATFAGLDEILQGPVGRTPDLLDWFFDCLGIVSGLALVQLALWQLNDPNARLWTNRIGSLWRSNATDSTARCQQNGLAR